MGHHSTSDDSTKYRPVDEIEWWSSARDPVARFRQWIESNGWWCSEDESELRKSARKQVKLTVWLKEISKNIDFETKTIFQCLSSSCLLKLVTLTNFGIQVVSIGSRIQRFYKRSYEWVFRRSKQMLELTKPSVRFTVELKRKKNKKNKKKAESLCSTSKVAIKVSPVGSAFSP